MGSSPLHSFLGFFFFLVGEGALKGWDWGLFHSQSHLAWRQKCLWSRTRLSAVALGFQGHRTQSLVPQENPQRLCALSICLWLSHAFSPWPQTLVESTHASQPRTSSHTLSDQTAGAFASAFPSFYSSLLKSPSLSSAIISGSSHNSSLCRPLRLLIPI